MDRRCERFMSSMKWLQSAEMYSIPVKFYVEMGFMWFYDHIECSILPISLCHFPLYVAERIKYPFESSMQIKGIEMVKKVFPEFHLTIAIFRQVINASMCRKSVESSFMHHSISDQCHCIPLLIRNKDSR